MKVSAVIISHGHAAEVSACAGALAPQVDEVAVVANIPRSVDEVPAGTIVLHNEQPLGFAANANRGFAATSGEALLLANPDTLARPDAVAQLRSFVESQPRCGIAGPTLLYPDGTWQPSRRRFPTVLGTLVRRTPLRWFLDPRKCQARHYLLEEQPSAPVPADWLLGGFLLLRREMLEEIGGLDEGFRLYCEDIDLAYRASRAGWERWLVPSAVVVHAYAAVIDKQFLTRRTLWHMQGMWRFVRKHPETLRAIW